MLKSTFFIFFWILFLCTCPFLESRAQSNAEVRAWRKQANSGDPVAMYKFAKYHEDRGNKAGLRRAFKFYEQSADLSFDSAQYALAKMYELGRGAPQNHLLAEKYFKAAADQGHAQANFTLGNMYEEGVGNIVPKDPQKAVNHYLKAKEAGYAPAKQRLETLPVDSLGDQSSLSYVLYMAEKGSPNSMFIAAQLYMAGRSVEKDELKAFNYFRQAADQNFGPAQLELGKIYANGLHTSNINVAENKRLAVINFIKAANNGVGAAETELGKYDIENYITAQNSDYQIYKARKAGDGSAEEKYQLYLKYSTGDGIEKDPRKAFDYLQQAADAKDPNAMMAMAKAYEEGEVVPKSLENALQWYRDASDAGNDQATLKVAEMYANGKGTKIDNERAIRWYLRAAGANSEDVSSKARGQLTRYKIEDYIDPNDLDYLKYKGKNGNSEAQMRIGRYFYDENDEKAINWLKMAAENNEAVANRLLGNIYLYGRCNQIRDEREAAKWYFVAAEKNDLEAMKSLAFMFSQNLIYGEGDNFTRAKQLVKRYLELTEGRPDARDKFIYKVIADIYAINDDYRNAISYYTSFINAFDPGKHQHMDMLKAIDARAICYYNLNDLNSSVSELEIALVQLEQYKDSPDVQFQYIQMKGVLNYRIGRVTLEKGNLEKSCSAFRQARIFGIQVEPMYMDKCAGASTGN